MHYSDKAIEKQEDDELGRSTFAQELGKAILSLDTSDNFVIALNGDWGCGKTSILNMAIEEIDKTADSVHKPIVIWFNPWNYSDTTQLINQFFKKLSEGIGRNDNSPILKKIGKNIEEYSAALEFTEFLPILGPISKLIKAFGSTVKDIAEASSDISQIKENIENDLKNQEQKIVIIIDDIDRLPNEQIRFIFQLVNSLAGFPNVRYLLSFDKDIVCNALKDVQKCDGEKYLEKIIQISFTIPPINRSKLENTLNKRISEFITEVFTTSNDNSSYRNKILINCVMPYIKNIRDINRLLNSFYLKYGLIGKETNDYDLLAITAFEIFDPTVLRWIYSNRANIVGATLPYPPIYLSNISDEKDKAILTSLNEICLNNDKRKNSITTLFPRLARAASIYLYEEITSDQLNLQSRIAYDKKFNLYFSLTTDDIIFDKDFLDQLFINYPMKYIKDFFINLKNHPIFDEMIIELRIRLDLIDTNRILNLLRMALIDLDFEYTDIYKSCIDKMFRKLPSNSNYEFLTELFQTIPENRFYICSIIMRDIELAYGRNPSGNRKENFEIITLEQLESLEKNYLSRADSIKNILDCTNARMIILIWEMLNQDTSNYELKELLTDEINVLKFINSFALAWYGTSRGWSFEPKEFEKYITLEYAYTILMKNIQKIDQFNEEFQLRLGAFYFWYNNENRRAYDTEHSEAEILKLLIEWKSKE